MVHFLLIFSNNAENSPFAMALREMGVAHRIFSERVLLRYSNRIKLLLVGWPKLIWFALMSAWKSLGRSYPYPDAVVVGSHLEALIFWGFRCMHLRRKPKIFLIGFIYTGRKSRMATLLRRLYFNAVFFLIDGIVCHSALEVGRYESLFPAGRKKFHYIPYGLHVDGYEQQVGVADTESYALSAGRSGRDYPTLCRAFDAIDLPLHVVCDSKQALKGCVGGRNIKVLQGCYDDAYLGELGAASMVIVPLAVEDISAGQMVILQAMAFKKPLIVTKTPTVDEYLVDGENAILVPMGDVDALRAAVDLLRSDSGLRKRLALNAFHDFERKHSMRAFIRNIVDVLKL